MRLVVRTRRFLSSRVPPSTSMTGRRAHAEVAPAAVPDLGFNVVAVVERFHLPTYRNRLAVKVVGLSADGQIERIGRYPL